MTKLIRSFNKADIPVAVDIANDAMLYPWTEAVFNDCLKASYQGWVLLEPNKSREKETLGFAIMLTQLDECQICNICVKPKFQKLGYGRKLLLHIIRFAITKNLARIILEVRSSNLNAIKMYRHFGFVEVGIRKNYYPTAAGREDALTLMLALF